ncbi:unannotated protein [freshwater metagenome]|uniref:NAD(+) diphosphatase n=1 Tax=freshwater metagenome TaxID=449393 RepID=A0A6J7HUA9_9ZZZZ|nr:NAD(+) diphosphatase [Actinomycetota bacterium]
MPDAAPPVPLSVAAHDRGDRYRRDDAWLAAARQDDATDVLVVDVEGRIAASAEGLEVGGPELLAGVAVPTLLAVDPDGSAVFAVAAAEVAEPPELVPFRDVLEHLEPDEAALAVQAIALVRWQADHRFCGRCGTATTLTTAGHRRVCPGCGARHFPRTDPVATMLVTDGRDRVLLSRRRGAKEKVWSCLAGFVEPGETPEQAVVRETMEEVGLRVLRVESIGSQPWPQPYELMIGHRAVVLPREPTVAEELVTARWWDRAELAAALAADEARLPPPYTIGHHAISVWLAEG